MAEAALGERAASSSGRMFVPAKRNTHCVLPCPRATQGIPLPTSKRVFLHGAGSLGVRSQWARSPQHAPTDRRCEQHRQRRYFLPSSHLPVPFHAVTASLVLPPVFTRLVLRSTFGVSSEPSSPSVCQCGHDRHLSPPPPRVRAKCSASASRSLSLPAYAGSLSLQS
jgi:hypothetical protein